MLVCNITWCMVCTAMIKPLTKQMKQFQLCMGHLTPVDFFVFARKRLHDAEVFEVNDA